ncbi:MAG: hypothetical protein GKR90_12835 [Pseudomonadales bacterium]|nr:hypothetical protein [Pseudomonadales bacterium]
MSRVIPRPTAASEPYWAGCAEGVLHLQQCARCNHIQFYPRICCSTCAGNELRWVAASGRGRVASFTVMHQQMADEYAMCQVVALIDLDEGPRMMSHVVGDNATNTKVGDRVRVKFQEWGDGVTAPVFALDYANAK